MMWRLGDVERHGEGGEGDSENGQMVDVRICAVSLLGAEISTRFSSKTIY